MKAYKQTENRIAWMRKNVRCGTCRWWSATEVCDASNVRVNTAYTRRWYSSLDSCASSWEPKEASDGR